MARKPRVIAAEPESVEAETPRRGRPPKAPEVTVRCLINNLWTSRGKMLRGQEATIPAEEAEAYDAADKVKILRAF